MSRFRAGISLVIAALPLGSDKVQGQAAGVVLPPAVQESPPAVLHSQPIRPGADRPIGSPSASERVPSAPRSTPMLRPGPTARPPLPSSLSAEFAPEVDSPPLEGPIGLETFPPLAGPALGEPLPAEGDSTLRALDPLPPPRTRSLDHEPVDVKAKPKPDPNEPPPSPPRRRGLFRQWVEGPTPDRDRSTARLEFDDPATRTALRKELEQQARDAGGRQLRSVEVRLTDTEVVIRGRANNFLNRRALKKKLESLPGLAGVPSTVVVD